jgi:Zn-dependent peptidase ImmA (M78 family)
MTKRQRVARPLSREQLEELAWKARQDFGLRPFERVPVARLLEHVVPELIEEFELRVVETGALGAAEAITDATKPIITFDERVYDGMCREQARYRMTGIHELGHLLLHTGQTGLAFMAKPDPRVDLERQADIFAEAFMMPECAFREVGSIRQAMTRFGVSRDAACFRARALKMSWLIGGKRPPRRAKKKGYDKRRTP